MKKKIIKKLDNRIDTFVKWHPEEKDTDCEVK